MEYSERIDARLFLGQLDGRKEPELCREPDDSIGGGRGSGKIPNAQIRKLGRQFDEKKSPDDGIGWIRGWKNLNT